MEIEKSKQKEPSKAVFEAKHLNQIIQRMGQKPDDTIRINDRPKEIILDIGNAFIDQLLQESLQIAKIKQNPTFTKSDITYVSQKTFQNENLFHQQDKNYRDFQIEQLKNQIIKQEPKQ